MSTQKSKDISESAVMPNAGVVSGAGKPNDMFADEDSQPSERLSASKEDSEDTDSPEMLDETIKRAESEVMEKVRGAENNSSES